MATNKPAFENEDHRLNPKNFRKQDNWWMDTGLENNGVKEIEEQPLEKKEVVLENRLSFGSEEDY